jgi:hypothetical protein
MDLDDYAWTFSINPGWVSMGDEMGPSRPRPNPLVESPSYAPDQIWMRASARTSHIYVGFSPPPTCESPHNMDYAGSWAVPNTDFALIFGP